MATGRPLRIQKRYDGRISQVGSLWVIKEAQRAFPADPSKYQFKALFTFLAQNDFPEIDLEGEDNSTSEFGPITLYAVERLAWPIVNGWFKIDNNVHLANVVNPDKENYGIRSFDTDDIGNVTARLFGLIARKPLWR